MAGLRADESGIIGDTTAGITAVWIFLGTPPTAAIRDFARHYGFHPAVHTVANTKGKPRSATFDPKTPKPQYCAG